MMFATIPALVAPFLPGDFVRALAFEPLGDLNNDGVSELAIGLPRDDAHGVDAGRVFVLDGLSGKVLRELHEAQPGYGYGFALACGDFDADGKQDLAVASHRDGFTRDSDDAATPGKIDIFSLADGSWKLHIGAPTNSRLGNAFASVIHAVGGRGWRRSL